MDNNIQFYDVSSGNCVLDTNQSNAFTYSENIKALYVDFSKPLSKKVQAKFGLRLENTNTTGVSLTKNQTNKNSYTKLFPSLYLGYNVNQNK